MHKSEWKKAVTFTLLLVQRKEYQVLGLRCPVPLKCYPFAINFYSMVLRFTAAAFSELSVCLGNIN